MSVVPKLTVYQYCKDMEQNNIILSFKGTVSQEILADVGISLRTKFGAHNLSKKIFAIFVELAQNIYHHSAQKEYLVTKGRPSGIGLIMVQNMPDHLVLTSGNVINMQQKAKLLNKCEYINSLDEEALREYYKSQRKKPDAGGTGANIGLIDIARRSGYPLAYSIQDIDDEYAFFALSVRVNKEDEA
ncbi:MAG: SiaB family protein kinase [Microscillaceae bacterium]|nr:SiaB family protein kinase [Microscillaceae bacterium]MDW8460195.1 SiaB family protein kinase [Cytophagales bacterium]